MSIIIKPLALIFFLCCLQGCSIFLPAHEHSGITHGESATITLINSCETNTLKKELDIPIDENQLSKIKGDRNCDTTLAAPPLAAAAVAVVTGLVVDHVVSAVKEEASKHIASFSKTRHLLEIDNNKPIAVNLSKYDLLVLDRYITTGNRNHLASRLVLKLYISDALIDSCNENAKCDEEQTHNLIAVPVIYRIKEAKAKLSAVRWWSYIPIFWYQFFNDNDELRVKVQLWVDGVSDSLTLEKVTLGDSETVLLNEDIFNKVISNNIIPKNSYLLMRDLKPFSEKYIHSINFEITESDTSKAEENYKATADAISQLKEPIQTYTKERLTGKSGSSAN